MTTPTQAAKPRPFYKWTTHDKRAANLIGVPCVLIAEKDFAALTEALKGLTAVIEAAGLHNLTQGVQLGSTVWYVKASDAMEVARAALASVEPQS